MKFDKNTLNKQRFWLCLGGAVLTVVIGLLTVKVSAGDKIDKARKKYADATKAITATLGTDPKNANFWDPWIETANTYKKHIEVVWKDAWDLQKDKITFPTSEDMPLQKLWDDADSFLA